MILGEDDNGNGRLEKLIFVTSSGYLVYVYIHCYEGCRKHGNKGQIDV